MQKWLFLALFLASFWCIMLRRWRDENQSKMHQKSLFELDPHFIKICDFMPMPGFDFSKMMYFWHENTTFGPENKIPFSAWKSKSSRKTKFKNHQKCGQKSKIGRKRNSKIEKGPEKKIQKSSISKPKSLKNSPFWPKNSQKQAILAHFPAFSANFVAFLRNRPESAETGSEASLRPLPRLEIGQKLRFWCQFLRQKLRFWGSLRPKSA